MLRQRYLRGVLWTDKASHQVIKGNLNWCWVRWSENWLIQSKIQWYGEFANCANVLLILINVLNFYWWLKIPYPPFTCPSKMPWYVREMWREIRRTDRKYEKRVSKYFSWCSDFSQPLLQIWHHCVALLRNFMVWCVHMLKVNFHCMALHSWNIFSYGVPSFQVFTSPQKIVCDVSVFSIVSVPESDFFHVSLLCHRAKMPAS